MLTCSSLYLNQRQQGYGLIALILLLIALAGSGLAFLLLQQQRAQQAQIELQVESLHQFRLGVLRYFQVHGHWPLAPEQVINEGASTALIEQYLQSVQLIAEPAAFLRVRFYRPEWAAQVQPFLAASSLHSDAVGTPLLHLSLVTSPAANASDSSENRWLRRDGSNAMATDFTLTQKSIQQARAITTPQLSVEQQAWVTNLTTTSAQSNQLQADVGQIYELHSNTIAATAGEWLSLSSTATKATELLSEQVTAQTAVTENAQVGSVSVAELNVAAAVQLNAADSQQFRQLQLNLLQLRNDLEHCMFSSRWCEAIAATPFSLTQCSGCSHQQSTANFQANIQLSGTLCVHGCSIQLQPQASLPSLSWQCSPALIAPLQVLQSSCTLNANLAENSSWQSTIAIRAHNRKQVSVFTERSAVINWQRQASFCPGFTQAVAVTGAWPPSQQLLQYSDTPLGDTATAFASGFDCWQGQNSTLQCTGSAVCSDSGEWQQVVGSCLCSLNEL